MPYFSWVGINVEAQVFKGVQFAPNAQELDAALFKKEIALLSAKTKRIVLYKPLSLQTKINYFKQLAVLITAGISLPESLALLAAQTDQSAFGVISHDIFQQVSHGISFSTALKNHPKIFNSIMIHMISVGQESGNLAAALEVLAAHLESLALFKGRLKSALLLPLVTFLFFMVILAVILIVIVPQFASIFITMKKDLPPLTQVMIVMSNGLIKGYFLIPVIAGLAMYGVLKYYKKTTAGKNKCDDLLLKIPLIKAIIINKSMAGFFQATSFLLKGGMPLVQAIHIAKESVNNHKIAANLYTLEQEVNAGSSFGQALMRCHQLCSQEVICLVNVGQEAGMLTPMLVRIATLYQERLMHLLTQINTLFQPFLLIILGLLIGSLILALYAPIMNLSSAI